MRTLYYTVRTVYHFLMTNVSTKDRILAAATDIVLRVGTSGMSIDAVALEAGISKGGLLYHYPTKNELLAALIRQFIDQTDAEIAESMAEDSGAGSWTRGYVAASTLDPDATNTNDKLGAALLAAAASDPALLEPLRRHQAVWRQSMHNDGIDQVTASIVRLAADGLWMNDLFGLNVLSDDERTSVLARLLELTRS